VASEEYKKMGDFSSGVQMYVEGLKANEENFLQFEDQIGEIDEQVKKGLGFERGLQVSDSDLTKLGVSIKSLHVSIEPT
jgi:hypothetical protein